MIREKVARLAARMHDGPQYPSQGAVLFVDLERREHFRKYSPSECCGRSSPAAARTCSSSITCSRRQGTARPQIPMIFGSGVFTGTLPTPRAATSQASPPTATRSSTATARLLPGLHEAGRHRPLRPLRQAAAWTLLELSGGRSASTTPLRISGWTTPTSPGRRKGFLCAERKDMAMARITRAGENLGPVLRNHGGRGDLRPVRRRREDGSLRLKAVMILGRGERRLPPAYKENNRDSREILSTSVVKYALRRSAPPSSTSQAASSARWERRTTGDDLVRHPRRRQLRRVPARHGRLLPVPDPLPPVERPHPGRKGGVGRERSQGVTGNAGYDEGQAGSSTVGRRATRDPGDGRYDRHDKGDGPDYVTWGRWADDRDPGAGTVLRLKQHPQRSRVGRRQHGKRDRLGDGALPARHPHARRRAGYDLAWGSMK